MQESSGYGDNKRAKAADILVDFRFTDATHQTLDYITIHLKDLFDAYGYIPKTDAIPVEWIKKYINKIGASNEIMNMHRENLKTLIKDWEKENEID